MKAILLSAGRGKRLRPLTDHTPKPLLAVAGKPLLQWHIEALEKSGFHDLVINLGYLGEQIRERFGDGRELGVLIRYSTEPPEALETGGGLLNALPLLGNAPFLAVNADIVTDYPFAKLANATPQYARWILVDNPAHNPSGDFRIDHGQLSPSGSGGAKHTFSGIAVYHPRLFANLTAGRFSITPTIQQLAQSGKIEAEHYSGLWLDAGSLASLENAQEIFSARLG